MPMPNEQKVETRLPSAPILANPMLAVRCFSCCSKVMFYFLTQVYEIGKQDLYFCALK